MNAAAASLSIPMTKGNFACVRCSERKVGCDRQNPCGACVRHNVPCIVRPPKPPRRKQGPSKEKLVLERLKRYEALLQEKGINPHQVAGGSEPETPSESNSLTESETVWRLPMQATIFKPRLVHRQSGTELVDNNLWSRVAEEIHDDEATLGDDSENDGSDGEASDDDFSFVLGSKSPITTPPSHPPAEIIRQLWQTFIENVNPLMKVVHIPSLQTAMDKAISNIENIPRGFEALMFAIYHIAIISLTDDECKEVTGETRAILLRRYLAATKAALSRARFMSTSSIVVLQALAIHLISIRDIYEPRAVWNLTGVAIRIAEGMGMRIDGKLLGLSPFETEIRRRLWWQLKLHDSRAAELCGQAKFQDFALNNTSPKKPANVNDADLYPSMVQAPEESIRPTEMLWCMFRTELAGFASAQIARMPKLDQAMFTNHEYAAMDGVKVKENSMEGLIDDLETKYLRFCDPSQPLQLMVLFGARCATNIIRFMTYHPRKWVNNQDQVPASEQKLVWDIVLQLLEQYNQMQSNPQLRRFAWNVPYFIQWHAVIHVLDSLRAKPLHVDAWKAWGLVNTLYETNLEMCLSTKKAMFVAIGSLCLKAFDAREAAMAKDNKSVSNTPKYIIRLREQREEARARREAAVLRNKQREAQNGEKQSTPMDAGTTWQDVNHSPENARVEAQAQQNPTATQAANTVQSGARTGDDAFWLNDAANGDTCACGSADPMNLDSNNILAQDYWFDTPSGEVIDWAKWDTWLGNNDPVRPSFAS
ncbi:hypothetical protein V501_04749 [Pseudogymnoascus sp. VKM F-4519 (FW-2642)]|nr:hypothetical protein V501_04749 [Pseudogymnoascus sp. VKM F-4519 (FW-2642)]